MLKLLRIKNIALVAELELELGPGLTLLTGETGAGKSILIDALGLLVGMRASADLIRSGEDTAVVEGILEHAGAERLLAPHGLPVDGRELVVRREIQSSGKGRATLNGALVPVALLRTLGAELAALHGQHEPQGLLDPETHLDVLHRHAGLTRDAEEVARLFRRVHEAQAALDALRQDAREAERRRETLAFQAAEIEKAALRGGEEDELALERVRQANAGRLASLSEEAYALLYDSEDAVVARLGQVYRRLEDLASLEPRFRPHLEARDSLKAQLEDLALTLRDYRDDLSVTPGRLDEIESRLALIERLKRKYGASLEEVLAFGERCRAELADLASPEERERRLAAERAAAAEAFRQRAASLSRARRAAARELAVRVQAELAQLAMEKTRFEVGFDPAGAPSGTADESSWSERGLETGQFLLAPNPGEELRPLARIASGGELSRILLALKSVASLDEPGKTLVFDEVDAGIGGRVAEVVGRKLKAIAARHQVLCVTHLPQIASLADRHYAVRKRVTKGRTLTEVVSLEGEARVDEVARMLGGETITDAARRHAREMVRQSLRA
jgi:DNA repair protein RecN (Recombination protein N)